MCGRVVQGRDTVPGYEREGGDGQLDPPDRLPSHHRDQGLPGQHGHPHTGQLRVKLIL